MFVEWLDKLIAAVIASVVAAFVLLIRKVLVNEEAIKLLQQDAEARETRRQEEREIFKELKDDLKDIRQELKDLYRQNNNYK